jgi:uncharacterized membrane protein YbhN (UPF0104 family)
LNSSKVKAVVQTILLIICLLFLGKRLTTYWKDIQQLLIELDVFLAAVSFLLLSLGFLIFPSSMVIFTRKTSKPITYLYSARAYFGSQLTKYLPGGIWVIPSRVVLLREMGFDATTSSLALATEMISLASASFLLGLLSLGPVTTTLGWNPYTILILFLGFLLAIGLLIVSPELLARFLPSRFTLPEAFKEIARFSIAERGKSTLFSIMLYLVQWSIAGLGFHLLLISIDPQIGASNLLFSVGVFSFSWVIGYITIVSPGGIGVRESILVILLGTLAAEPIPILAAILYRMYWLVIELLLFAVVWLYKQTSQKAH